MRARLLVATLAICLVLVLAAFWCANQAARSAAQMRFAAAAQQTVLAMQEASGSRIATLSQGVEAALLDPIFRAQLSRLRQSDASFGLGESGDEQLPVAQVHDVIASADLPYFKSYALFLVATPTKLLLYNRAQPDEQGNAIADLELLAVADRQDAAVAYVPGDAPFMRRLGADPAELYQVIAKKISVAGQDLGYVLVGESVRKSLLADLDRVSQASAGIAIGTKVWSRDPVAQRVAQDYLAGNGVANGADYTWSGLGYFVHKTDAGLVLVKAIHEELALLEADLRLRFLEFVLPLALLALLGATAMAQYFSRPLRTLTDAVRQVKAGNYAAKMPTRRGDEVGELARAFNDMTESLSALRIDPLTGLYSEQYLKDTLAFEMVHCATQHRDLALVNLRIFDFEKALETDGEEAIRDRLQAFAERLATRYKRLEDVAARGEEDEFWLLLVGADSGTAKARCHQILADRDPAMPPLLVGLALLNPQVGEVEGFMALARDAAEQARRAGPGTMGLGLGLGMGAVKL